MNEVRGVHQGTQVSLWLNFMNLTLLPPGGWLRVRTVIAHEKVRCLLCPHTFSLLL